MQLQSAGNMGHQISSVLSIQHFFGLSEEVHMPKCLMVMPLREPHGVPWSWNVMEFSKTIVQAWKVMESYVKIMENDHKVMIFL